METNPNRRYLSSCTVGHLKWTYGFYPEKKGAPGELCVCAQENSVCVCVCMCVCVMGRLHVRRRDQLNTRTCTVKYDFTAFKEPRGKEGKNNNLGIRKPEKYTDLTTSFHAVHGVLKARILKWFATPFPSGPRLVKTLHHDPSILGGGTRHGSQFH